MFFRGLMIEQSPMDQVSGDRFLPDFSRPYGQLADMVDLVGNHMPHDFTEFEGVYFTIWMMLGHNISFHAAVPSVDEWSNFFMAAC